MKKVSNTRVRASLRGTGLSVRAEFANGDVVSVRSSYGADSVSFAAPRGSSIDLARVKAWAALRPGEVGKARLQRLKAACADNLTLENALRV